MSSLRRIIVQFLSGVTIALCLISPVESAYPPFRGLKAIEEPHSQTSLLPEKRDPTPWRWQFTNTSNGLNTLPDLLSRFTASSKAIENLSHSPAVLNGPAEFFSPTPFQIGLTTSDLYRITSGRIFNAFAHGWQDFSLPVWTTIELTNATGACSPSATECSTSPHREPSESPTPVSNLGTLLLIGSGLLSLAAQAWHQYWRHKAHTLQRKGEILNQRAW